MSHTLILIAALQALNVHGSHFKCLRLAETLAKVANFEVMNSNGDLPIHWDEDINAIVKFNNACERKHK